MKLFENSVLAAYATLSRPTAEAITDDTQMTLFTAEGLLRAHVRGRMCGLTTHAGVTDHAYLRWLETQGVKAKYGIGHDGWLWGVEALHHRRAPGNTCLSALMAKEGFGDAAVNDSKGCGGVMRVAPAGLFAWHFRNGDRGAEQVFDLGAELAGLTHGHPSGQWPAGVFALLVMRALEGIPLREALEEAKRLLRTKDRHQETLNALLMAEALAASGVEPSAAKVETLGAGWVAEEALAISVYCALVARDFEHGVSLAVNHGGDSDSTGAITGNLLGAVSGVEAIPGRWVDAVELREEIESIADDLFEFPTWRIGEYGGDDNDRIWERYPGW
jgi:ADP-ribosylglycohydrolase